MNGDVEMDGAHQSGWRANEKLGKPQGSRPVQSDADPFALTEIMLTQTGKDAARKEAKNIGPINPEFGNRLPKDRRILFAI